MTRPRFMLSVQCPLTLLLFLAGCSASSPSGDAGPADAGALSESGLAFCKKPGEVCRPADPCGLNNRCGIDLLCHSQGRRHCDDGVPCTQDRCVSGGCDHRPLSGRCFIDGVCYSTGQVSSCGKCQPDKDPLAWTPLSGNSCNDGNLCTFGDTCRQGTCIGEFYSCDDGLGCTQDLCDGAGPDSCHHELASGYCIIDGACTKEGQTDPTGCLACQPSVSTSAWTPRTSVCTISGQCYSAGTKDPSGCNICDPAHTATSWTALPDLCDVGGSCVAAGTVHPSQCAICSPSTNSKFWTALPGASLSWTSFGSGLSGYEVSKIVGGVGWQLAKARYRSPGASLYYGDPQRLTYDNGQANQGTATSPPISLPPQQKAFVAFQAYLDIDVDAKSDLMSLTVQGKQIWGKSTLAASDYKKWIQVVAELTPWAGQSVSLQFSFNTVDAQKNGGEGVYLDDITVLTGCGGL